MSSDQVHSAILIALLKYAAQGFVLTGFGCIVSKAVPGGVRPPPKRADETVGIKEHRTFAGVKVVSETANLAGVKVMLAEDGFDALAKITDHQPDIIFVDIMMPRLDGYQTCALIKKNTHFATTPVIMLSSKDGLFDRARGRMVGSDEYLTKPFTKDSLLKTIGAHAPVRT